MDELNRKMAVSRSLSYVPTAVLLTSRLIARRQAVASAVGHQVTLAVRPQSAQYHKPVRAFSSSREFAATANEPYYVTVEREAPEEVHELRGWLVQQLQMDCNAMDIFTSRQGLLARLVHPLVYNWRSLWKIDRLRKLIESGHNNKAFEEFAKEAAQVCCGYI